MMTIFTQNGPRVFNLSNLVHYIFYSLLLLGVESRDFSQGQKERTACNAEQIHKMTTIFTENDNLGSI